MFSSLSFFGVLLMAGKGTRLNEATPKQYMQYEGKPLFMHAYERMASSSYLDAILCVIGNEEGGLARDFINLSKYAKPTYFVYGGASRTDSVHNALNYLKENGAREDAVILLHDAARPNLEEIYIIEGVRKAREGGASVTCYPSSDSVALGDGKELSSYLDRRTVYILGTPQSFTLEVLDKAFLRKDPSKEYTDDGSLVLDTLGIKPLIVLGKHDNIKITFPEDIH